MCMNGTVRLDSSTYLYVCTTGVTHIQTLDTYIVPAPLQHPKSTMTGMMIPKEQEEEESPSPAKKIRKLPNDEEEVCEDMLGMHALHTCHVTVHLCLLLQDSEAGESEDHSAATTLSAAVAVNQRDDIAVSSSYSGCSTDDDCSAPITPPSFTRVCGASHWRETSARTDLSYIHPQTARYLTKATVRPKEKVG